jgi:hypothetical protein
MWGTRLRDTSRQQTSSQVASSVQDESGSELSAASSNVRTSSPKIQPPSQGTARSLVGKASPTGLAQSLATGMAGILSPTTMEKTSSTPGRGRKHMGVVDPKLSTSAEAGVQPSGTAVTTSIWSPMPNPVSGLLSLPSRMMSRALGRDSVNQGPAPSVRMERPAKQPRMAAAIDGESEVTFRAPTNVAYHPGPRILPPVLDPPRETVGRSSPPVSENESGIGESIAVVSP